MCTCVYIYIYIEREIYILKGHQKGVEQKGVFEHNKPNFECLCVCKSASSIRMVYPMQVRCICAESHFGHIKNPHEIHSANNGPNTFT